MRYYLQEIAILVQLKTLSKMFTTAQCQSSRLRYMDLEKQIWREISTLSDFRLIKEKIRKKASADGHPLSAAFADQKVKDIQYCIKQAFEYFKSSKEASVLIKPTLIYYGLISLASATIILRNREKSLHTMREAHGLKDKYPDKLKSIDINAISRKDIFLISAEIQESGTFVELLDMDLLSYFTLPIKHTGRPDTSKDYSQVTNFLSQYPGVKEINLLAIFQNIPEIWKECRLSLKETSFVCLGEAVSYEDKIACRVTKDYISRAELEKNFTFASKAAEVLESSDYYFFNLSNKLYQQIAPLTKQDTLGNQYLTADLNNPLITSDYLLYYLAFFILGSLSRYKPALWRLIIEDEGKGLNNIPEILCDSAYIKIPLHFLNELDSKFYKI